VTCPNRGHGPFEWIVQSAEVVCFTQMHFTVQRRLRHSRHPAVAQPRLVAHKPPGLDQSRSHPKTYPPRTTTRLASGIRLRLAHTSSCGRTESRLGEMAPQHTVLKVHQGSRNHNHPNPRCHHDRARSHVYHHGSACTNTSHTALISLPTQFHHLTKSNNMQVWQEISMQHGFIQWFLSFSQCFISCLPYVYQVLFNLTSDQSWST